MEYIWNPAKCSCANGKCLGSITDDSVIIGDEIMEAETKTVPSNFNEKKNKLQNTKLIYFTCVFVNYHSIIDSC